MPSDAAKVLKILAWTWGPLIHWTPPRIERTVGPYIPDAFEAYAGKVESCLRECREWADKMAIEYHLDSFDEQGRATLGPLRDQQDQLAKRVNNIAAGPVWISGGLGNPQYYADFEYWSKMPFFTLHEATCLTLGIEPKHLDEGLLTTGGPSDTAKGDVVAFAQRRREQLRQQFDPYNQKSKIPRKLLVDWVKTIELEVHVGMQTIGKNIDGLADPSAAAPISAHQITSAQQVESREKASMAKLIVAMAIDGYGYSPKQARSPIPQEIESIAAKLGLELSHDTIRKYLRLGASLLPKD